MFTLINAIVDRLGDSVKPFAEGLMQLLPQAWEDAEGHSLLRMQILVSLQKLVHALGLDSWICHPLLLHLLPLCVDVSQVCPPRTLEPNRMSGSASGPGWLRGEDQIACCAGPVRRGSAAAPSAEWQMEPAAQLVQQPYTLKKGLVHHLHVMPCVTSMHLD